MPIDQDRDRKRGLPAVHTLRAARKTGRFGRTTVTLLIYGVAALAVVMVAYNWFSNRAIEDSRRQLAGEVKAARATVGAKWTLLRDELEALSLGENGAATYPGDLTDPDVHGWDFRDDPGFYVRIPLSDLAGDPSHRAEDFRRSAQFSVHDGFTSCLLRAEASKNPTNGILSDQPWNLKTAYQAVRVLGDDWLHEVDVADSQLRLRAFAEQWQTARDDAIPRAIDMMTRATFYLLVYDEDVAEMAAITPLDGGVPGMAELQIIPHPVRIQLVDLRKKKLLLRRRLTVDSSYRLAGESAQLGEGAERAVRRQVQNCQLGRDFWRAAQAPAVPTP